ncbi:MAG: hypothetical protein RLZZ519_1682 [Bacteroidota bacterium]|jgi:SNF2 family DNA or RNA helicase
MRDHPQDYVLENFTFANLGFPDILQHSTEGIFAYKRGAIDIQPAHLKLNAGAFSVPNVYAEYPTVGVVQSGNSIVVTCPCKAVKRTLCKHQSEVLCNILDRPSLRIFFDEKLRTNRLKEYAKDYGLQNEPNLDAFFEVNYAHNNSLIVPKIKEMLPLTEATKLELEEQLLPKRSIPEAVLHDADATAKTILVFRPHKYYNDQFHIELFEVQTANNGKIKPPFTPVDPQYRIWNTDNIEEAKFYIAISKFQATAGARSAASNVDVLKAIARNPLQLEVFYHKESGGTNLSAKSLAPVLLQVLPMEVKLTVVQKEPFFEVTGELWVKGKTFKLDEVDLKFEHFILLGNTLNLVSDANTLRVMDFFRKHHHKLLIHPSKFEEFRKDILTKLEIKLDVNYSFVKTATPKQISEQGFDQKVEKIIYLTEEKNYVYITPVVKYGNVEIAVFSRQQIYDTDANGRAFKVERNNELEIQFTSVLLRQHIEFEEQLEEHEYFYLHKSKFLDENWFIEVFEEWRNQGITILGFNALSKNKLNMNKGKVSVQVSSDTDWFDAKVQVQFGNQNASLKQIHKSVKNKSKFVQLDDGTLGILPDEWMQKFADYFQSGEIEDESIVIPKSRFMEINELFGQEVLDAEAHNEIAFYIQKFQDFSGIQPVAVPAEFQGSLRDYQKQGLNWLNFLDEFNFGACLADDMGLGKTIQIIALILLQRQKRKQNTNLIVVPTSLLFNWQAEVAKFAPSIKIFTNYGGNKLKDAKEMDQYEIILTTYGMLNSDIELLRKYPFNYIILDESQAIKNPESQRYKLVRLLHSRNKIALTGTPFENNTYDIYGQLSFACPGLLGTKTYFKNIYSNPIDHHEDGSKSNRLQRIIHPFVLRRTKQQVAQELPDKTEMVLYCEMGPQQRKLYDDAAAEVREMLLHKNSKKRSDNISKPAMYFLKGLTKLRQICDSPNILADSNFEGEVSSKIEVLMEQISSKSTEHKILVFSQFVTMLDLIKKELQDRNIPFAYLTGQTKNRAETVNLFQGNDSVRVFLISLKAGGIGLNLTEADYVYLVDPWWNPAVENQAIDRCYRIGQKKNVVAVKLICPGTVEEKIMLLQEKKFRLGSELIRTDEDILKSLTQEELLEILR